MLCNLDLCFDKCVQLSCAGLCAHLYSCSCPSHPICKHVHKVHSVLRKGQPVSFHEDINEYPVEYHYNSTESDGVELNNNVSQAETLSEAKAYQNIYLNLVKLQNMVQSKTIPSHLLHSGNTFLNQYIRRIETEVQQQDLQCFPKGRHIAPREKLVTQEAQLLPFKRKKKKVLKR